MGVTGVVGVTTIWLAPADCFCLFDWSVPFLFVALALVSAHRGEPLADADGRPLACFGEVGLTGELRAVGHGDRRLAEALKFGLGPVVGPEGPERLDGLAGAKTLRDALAAAKRRGLSAAA